MENNSLLGSLEREASPEKSYDEHISGVKAALIEFINEPIENDERIKTFRQALLQELDSEDDNSLVKKAFQRQYDHKVMAKNSDFFHAPAIYPANLALRAFQKVLMKPQNTPPGLDYPRDFDNPEAWIEGMRHVLGQEKLEEEFSFLFNVLAIQSNVADRYKTLKIGLNLYQERFGPQPIVLDVGCSQNHGLQLIAKNLDFFQPTKPALTRELPILEQMEEVRVLQELLAKPALLGEGVGVDVWFNPTDENIREWVKSCSHYPSELLDEKKIAYFDELTKISAPNVSFVFDDFAQPFPDTVRSSREGVMPKPGTVDVVTFFTVLYECSPLHRQKMLDRATNFLSEDGIIIVQDFAVLDPLKPGYINFDPWYHRAYASGMPYRSFVFDKTQTERGWQPFIDWSNGRCQKIRPGALAKELIAQQAR